ncbi:MAG: N-acetylmuramoyl-L-alanine amidase AmiC [Paracidovorax wautersii]|uniref:N-acetylmuramoyl-L-alanine amidase AmiC n=1 Tax=Paracidovorax wautersii TaxID=1177982 RepID=A0A7V8FPG1_9BURK|nr:MAG: N-acetylmuramoyl-L-alanine amidase AmiC [Paracidovorax wautersii]
MKRRQLLQGLQGGTLVLMLGRAQIAHGASIVAVRLWPADDYTRVTLESDTELKAQQVFIPNPPRLAVDLDNIQLNPALKELVAKVRADDPFISGVRAGQNTPTTVRLVFDLKQAARPQVFTLQPIPPYQYRTVFDLYPEKPVDPLEDLIASVQGTAAPRANNNSSSGNTGTAPVAPAVRGGDWPAGSTTQQGSPQAGHDALGQLLNDQNLLHDPIGDLIARQNRQQPPVAAAPAPAPAPRPGPSLPVPPPTNRSDTRSASAPPASPRVQDKVDRLIIVALDPGHGGEDPGAIGPGGTYEKDVVLQIAFKLRDRINAQPNMRAFMTRDADFFVPLYTRVEKARRVQADLFMSIHADGFTDPSVKGGGVYALSTKGATSAQARWIAQKENQSDLIGGVNVGPQDRNIQRIMLDMSTTAQIRDSMVLGKYLIDPMSTVGNMHKKYVEQAGFAVLKAPDIPSVLVETAFITNPDEERKLRTVNFQNDMADALLRGILTYFKNNPPLARNRQA